MDTSTLAVLGQSVSSPVLTQQGLPRSDWKIWRCSALCSMMAWQAWCILSSKIKVHVAHLDGLLYWHLLCMLHCWS